MKKIILILTFGLIMAVSAKAQIFLEEDEAGNRAVTDPGLYVGLPDNYGEGTDYFVPIGSGIVLFTALGGAYLLKKRNQSK